MVAVAFTRTATGLLYRSDGTRSGWYGADQWTTAADPRFVCHPTGRAILAPDSRVGEQDGVREPQLYVEGGTWWLLCDAGEGLTGWKQRLARSTDRGRTWERLGLPGGLGLSKKTSGTWAALATGWIEKRGATYYLHRVTSGNLFASPNVGLTAAPYFWDCWTATTPDGAWTASANVSGDNYAVGGAFTAEFLPGCVVRDGSVYRAFCQGGSGAGYVLGVCAAAASPDGPFVAPGSAFASSATAGLGSRQPENPKVFYSAALGRWVCLANLIAVAGTHTDANAVGYSASLTDWSGAVWHRTQRLCPTDGGARAVGVACHVTGPDGALIEGPGGEVPIVFDGSPKRYSPGWHLGREVLGSVLEPSARSLRIVQAANTTPYRISRELHLADFVAEYAVEFGELNAGGGSFRFGYRMDAAGENGYRVRHDSSGLTLEKVTDGVSEVVGSPTRTITGQATFFAHRVRVVVNGDLHQLYLDGDQQYFFVDLTSPVASGTHVELTAQGMTGDVRNLVVYSSPTLTVAGLVPGTSVELRSYGDLPVTVAVASATGEAELTPPHWPHYSLESAGSDPDGESHPLYGGDVIEASYPDGRPAAPAAVPPRARR